MITPTGKLPHRDSTDPKHNLAYYISRARVHAAYARERTRCGRWFEARGARVLCHLYRMAARRLLPQLKQQGSGRIEVEA